MTSGAISASTAGIMRRCCRIFGALKIIGAAPTHGTAAPAT
jgi:hypothetical protein